MKIKTIMKDLEATHEFKEWRKNNTTDFLAHIFMIVDKKGITWQAGYCNNKKDDKDEFITTFCIEDDKVKMMPAEKAFKKPGTTIKKLNLDQVEIDVTDCLERMHDIQHERYPSELPVRKIVVLQNIEQGQVYNVTYITSSIKTLNVKIDSKTGDVKDEKLEQLFQFSK